MQQESGPRITIHMAQSADGYISRHDEDIGWFETDDTYENGVEQETPSEAEEFRSTSRWRRRMRCT